MNARLFNILLVVVASLSMSACNPGGGAGSANSLPTAIRPQASIPEGLFESCNIEMAGLASCDAHLDIMAAGGFSLVINYNQLSSSAADLEAYLAHAHMLGMQVIVSVKDLSTVNPAFTTRYHSLAADCASAGPCTTVSQFLSFIANRLKDNPGLWGYYVGDEPAAGADTVIALCANNRTLRTADPIHPTLLVHMSARLLKPFAGCASYMGTDPYTYGISDMDGSGVLDASRDLSAFGTAQSIPTVLVLQAFGVSNGGGNCLAGAYPSCLQFPPLEVLLAEKTNALLGDPNVSMIFWYAYVPGITACSATPYCGDGAAAWQHLVTAARSAAGSTPPPAAPLPNLVSNPGLSNSAQGWTMLNGMSLSQSAGPAGAAAFSFSSNGGASGWPYATSAPIQVTPGATYRLSAWFGGLGYITSGNTTWLLIGGGSTRTGIYSSGAHSDGINRINYTVPADGSITSMYLQAMVNNATIEGGASVSLALPRLELIASPG